MKQILKLLFRAPIFIQYIFNHIDFKISRGNLNFKILWENILNNLNSKDESFNLQINKIILLIHNESEP